MSRACNFEWPCRSTCVEDFDFACPIGWTEEKSQICQMVPGFQSVCARTVDFSGMSEKDKSTFGRRCNTRWPCVAARKRSYTASCPDGWKPEGSVCVTTSRALMDKCGTVLSSLTMIEKKRLEAACGVKWPDAPVDCKKNYANPCPHGWITIGDGNSACIAPPGYKGCFAKQHFAGWSFSEKRDWEALCGAPWACIDHKSCETDWDASCPADWFTYAGGDSCIAPESYGGVCRTAIHGALILERNDKEAIAAKCGVAWPCFGEVNDARPTQGRYHEINNDRVMAVPTDASGPVWNSGAVNLNNF